MPAPAPLQNYSYKVVAVRVSSRTAAQRPCWNCTLCCILQLFLAMARVKLRNSFLKRSSDPTARVLCAVQLCDFPTPPSLEMPRLQWKGRRHARSVKRYIRFGITHITHIISPRLPRGSTNIIQGTCPSLLATDPHTGFVSRPPGIGAPLQDSFPGPRALVPVHNSFSVGAQGWLQPGPGPKPESGHGFK